jgi:hypothetical protein
MATNPSEIRLNVAESIAQVSLTFAMSGAREILLLTAGAVHIEQQIRALEESVTKNPSLAFDLAKALVESVCKTILQDRGQTTPNDDDLPKLFGTTLEQLRVLPDAHTADKETGRSIRKTAGALYSVVQAICELRNRQGFASHGKVAETEPLDSIQAELAARAADAVVSFLFKAHRQYAPSAAKPKRLEYEVSTEFNTFVDESCEPIRIFDLEYRPSEVLYYVDYEAYVEQLTSFGLEPIEEPAEAAESAEPREPAGTLEAAVDESSEGIA